MMLEEDSPLTDDFVKLGLAFFADTAGVPAHVKKERKSPLSPVGIRVVSPDTPKKFAWIEPASTEFVFSKFQIMPGEVALKLWAIRLTAILRPRFIAPKMVGHEVGGKKDCRPPVGRDLFCCVEELGDDLMMSRIIALDGLNL